MRPPRRTRSLHLRVISRSAREGTLECGHFRGRCALGRSGVTAIKREGDGATPAGRWRLVEVRWRSDRVPRPRTALPVHAIGPQDGWCDAPGDRNYNRPVRHPYPASAERLWREDHLYDVVVVLAYNLRPRAHGRGSAIFMHLARPGYSPTEGCIALGVVDMRRLLAGLSASARLVVKR
jgi:L,D-peptidoglycan transpeptidase YkuD (ErfK/YbiS/YcfS/YnhG family)